VDQEAVARMLPFLSMRRSVSTPPASPSPVPPTPDAITDTPPSPATPVRASARTTRGRPRGGGAAGVQFTPPSAPAGRGRGRGRAQPVPSPVGNSNTNILATLPTNTCTTGQIRASPAPGAQPSVFDRDATASTLLPDEVSEFMRTTAIREDAAERSRFLSTARNLFPDPFGTTPMAVPCTPRTPGEAYDNYNLEELFYQNTPSAVNVTANPFFGVRVSAPEPVRAMSRPPVASPSFIETPTVAKENQLFALPTVELLDSILKDALELRFLDKMQLAIITETRELITQYTSMISMVSGMTSVNPAFFKLLADYKSKMVRKMRVLTSSPVTSTAQRAMLAPLIHFMSEYSDTKGYGTPFPIKEFRKTKPYVNEFRSSFKDPSGGKSHSPFKPDNFNRRRDEPNPHGGGGGGSYSRPREDHYNRSPRNDRDRKPGPYNTRGRY
jgi:hypothetical protein